MNVIDTSRPARRAPVTTHGPKRAASNDKLPIAVIGGGFSGTMVAIHLASLLSSDQPILLCESDRLCRGAAYGTPNPGHMLNVRAANMSAFPRQADQFDRWLDAARIECPDEVLDTEVGRFASRGLYGRYLSSLLNRVIDGAPARVALLPREVTDIVPGGDRYHLICANGATHPVAGVVLAVGNVPSVSASSPLCRNNPWAADTLSDLAPDKPVLIIGTGLTMVDLALDLRARGFEGPVIAVSRRGLLPHRHAATQPWPTPVFSTEERGSLLKLVGRIRCETREAAELGVNWRSVIDSLRSVTSDLWQGLPPGERQRFLRHVRPYWDVHRHRLAPPVADQLTALLAQTFLTVRRARIAGIAFCETEAEVTLKLHGVAVPEQLTVQRVINATGLQTAIGADSRLIGNLCRRGLVRPDRLALGLDVTEALQAVGPDGTATPNLWALGPVVRGVFWECIAVPDIRSQAEHLSRRICGLFGATGHETPDMDAPRPRAV